MNPNLRSFVALVMMGMFIVPSGAAMASESKGGTGTVSTQQSPTITTGPAATPFYNPDLLVQAPPSRSGATGAPVLVPATVRDHPGPTVLNQGFPLMTTGRGSRAAPNVYPIEFSLVNPPVLDQWYGAGVIALKGAPTQFNLTVNNSGDADANPVTETFRVDDYFGKQMYTDTQTQNIPAGTNYTFYFTFIPAYCTYFTLNFTTHADGNAYAQNEQIGINVVFLGYDSNNQPVYARMATALWADNATSETGWSGDIASNKWHVTSNIDTDNASQHSMPSAWYQGRDILHQYENNLDISVKSPTLDFRNFGSYWFLHFDYLMHGALPSTDPGDYLDNSISTDGGTTWDSPFAKLDGPGIASNGAQMVADFKTSWLTWVTPVSGGQIMGLDITSDVLGKTGLFRNHFVSNNVNVDTGIYLDDFCIWGMEIQYDVGLTITSNLAGMKVNDLKTITASITNFRQAQPTSFNCSLNITKRNDPTHMLAGFPMVKQVQALGVGASADISFDWTPQEKGDYVVVVNITGMKDENHPNGNDDGQMVHVSGPSPSVLIVDDNPFAPPLNTTDLLISKLTNPTGGFDDYAEYFTVYGSSRTGNDYGGDGPTDTMMKQFDVVVWTTGWDSKNETTNGTLTANDQANIKSYLNSGGSLWLISMGTVNDLNGNTFMQNTLHVKASQNDTQIKGEPFGNRQEILPSPINGTPGSLADGAVYLALPPETTNWSYDETDLIQPDDQATGVFYGNATGASGDPWFVAIQIAGSYRMVFQTFDFAFIRQDSDQTDYVNRVIGFLMGGLSSEVYIGTMPNNHQLVDPGGQAVYTMTISNGGTKTRTLWNLDITQPPSGWTVTASPMVTNGDNPLDIATGDSVDITLTVTAPQKALAGTTAPIDINASFKSYTATLKNSTLTEVRAILGVGLTATNTIQNMTGPGVASFSFTLSNLGNLQVTAELAKTGDDADWLVLGSPTVTLQPYEQRLLSAVITVPDGVFKQAGNYTLKDILTASVTSQSSVAKANLTLITNIRIAQIFSVKIDDAVMDPVDGQADMSVAKPSVKLTVSVTAMSANGNDTASIELKAKSFTPTSGSSRSWDGSGWTLPKTTIDTTPFMINAQSGQLTVLVNPKADPGDYVLQVSATPGSGRLTDGDTTQVTITVARPDLQIVPDSVVYNPKEPQVGTPVTIKVTVKNTGGVAAKNIEVAFYGPGGNQIGDSQQIDTLAALSGTKTVQVTWDSVAEGENDIDIKVDPNNLIPESDKTNNELTDNTLIGYRSDVVIDAPPIFLKAGIAKTSVTDGDTVTIEADVLNQGTWGLNLTGVTVTMTDQTTGDTQTQTISINTRSDTKVDFTWAAHKVGTHTFSIKATPDGTINEKSTTNNEQTATLKVNAKPTGTTPIGGTMLYALIGVVVIIIVVALVVLMMRRKPAAQAAAPAEEKVDVVEAESVEVEGENK